MLSEELHHSLTPVLYKLLASTKHSATSTQQFPDPIPTNNMESRVFYLLIFFVHLGD